MPEVQVKASGFRPDGSARGSGGQTRDGAMHYLAQLEQDLAVSPYQSRPTREEADIPTKDRLLDVRTENPKRRNELICESFGALLPDTAFVLVNDHDPKPLYYQFAAENPGEFTWDYVEEGPEVWRVRIGRVAPPSRTAEMG